MAVDYPGAIDMLLPTSYSFNSVNPLKIVDHCTGGNMDLTSLHNTFLATMRSTHFGIDRNGNVAQFVPLNRGAGGNCCPDRDANGNLLCSSFWIPLLNQYGNLNLCTVSIEHCNDAQNSLPLTPAQQNASNKLNLWLCRRYNLGTLDIHSHASINPINKARCPGPAFNFQQMFTYINQQLSGSTDFMEQQFINLWMTGAGINADGSTWKAFKSGIFQAALSKFMAGSMPSPCRPTSGEIVSNDWGGNPGLIQTFSNGYYGFYQSNTHAILIYNTQNQAV
jgi:hypothetical protein